MHPWCQKPDLTSYLAKEGISAIAYSSLVPLAEWRTAEGHDSAKTDEMREDGAKTDSPIKGLASKYEVAEAQRLQITEEQAEALAALPQHARRQARGLPHELGRPKHSFEQVARTFVQHRG